jgi:hypothetical protein
MLKKIIIIIAIVVHQFSASATIFTGSKKAIAVEQTNNVAALPNNQTVKNTEETTSPIEQNKQPNYKQKLKAKAKKIFSDFTVGDNYDIFGIISLVSFFVSIIVVILAIGSIAGSAAVASGLALLLIAGLFSLISLITLIASGVRISQDPKLKGKGFFYTSLGLWIISLISNLRARI